MLSLATEVFLFRTKSDIVKAIMSLLYTFADADLWVHAQWNFAWLAFW